jgi:uncharacterized membrane protein YhaH (DUF805 family)
MKSIAGLFFSFDGRIGRTKFWLGMLMLAAVSFALVQATSTSSACLPSQ